MQPDPFVRGCRKQNSALRLNTYSMMRTGDKASLQGDKKKTWVHYMHIWQWTKPNHRSMHTHTHTHTGTREKEKSTGTVHHCHSDNTLSSLLSRRKKKMLGRSVPMATQHSRLAVDSLEHHYGGFEGNQRPCFQKDTRSHT